jgi:glycosyltransferase involved in cell wall biosynthesis
MISDSSQSQVNRKLLIVSEVYFPDEQGTAYYITGLAEGLAEYFRVTVFCGYPTVTARGSQVRTKETVNKVRVERCRGTTFNKNNLLLRLVNLSTLSLFVFFRLLISIRKGDIVLVVNGPHPLPLLTKVVCSIHKAKCILRIDDVYPEVLIATGVIPENSLTTRCFRFLNTVLYRRVDQVVVLGRDMKALAEKITRNGVNHIKIIHNWGDVDTVFPKDKAKNRLLDELGLKDRFVISCAGNMGKAQAIETMFNAISMIKNNAEIHFVFVGSGAKRPWMEREIRTRKLHNVTLVDQRPRSDQANFLNACDLAMASLIPGMAGAGVPSRMYNVMAAGKPLIAIAEAESELSKVVWEEQIGWVVEPDNPEKLSNVILEAYTKKEVLHNMGKRARMAAELQYSREKIIQNYLELIKSFYN